MKWEEKLTPASIKDNNRTSHQEMTILVAEDYQSNYDLIEAMLGKMYNWCMLMTVWRLSYSMNNTNPT